MGFLASRGLELALLGVTGCSAISGLSGIDFGQTGSGGGISSGGDGGGGSGPSPGICHDGKKDGDETDVDCGGSCDPCALGGHCQTTADCVAEHCTDGACQPDPIGVWAKVTPMQSPKARASCSMGWDGKTIRMFGGYFDVSGPVGNDGTHLWDGAAWTDAMMSNGQVERRYGAATTSSSLMLAVFGGGNDSDGPLDDLWGLTLGSDTWQQLARNGTEPPPRVYASAGVVGTRGVVFGGTADNTVFFDDTYILDASASSWTSLDASAMHPSGRAAAAMASSPDGAAVLLFGGIDSMTRLGDFWSWTPENNWTQLTASGPMARSTAGMVLASARGRVVLFSGGGDAGELSDTWEWDGKRWIRTATDGPPHASTCSAYDPNRRRVVVFGGQTGQDATLQIFGDTYEYHVRGGACGKDGDCDSGHCVDGLCCETTCGACQRCNDPAAPGLCTACEACDGEVCK